MQLFVRRVFTIFSAFLLVFTFGATQASAAYTLEPSEATIEMSLLTNYGVNVLLYEDGEFVTDQTGLSYLWQVSAQQATLPITLESNGYGSGCPYGINNPCPNLHASLRGVYPGTATVTVTALSPQGQIAETTFEVEVTTTGFTLESSAAEINMMLNSTQYDGYGVNVILKHDGYVVPEQYEVSYDWEFGTSDFIALEDEGFTNGCPYNIQDPCPNLHATITSLALGRTLVDVTASVENVELATTQFAVNVNDFEVTPSPFPSPSPWQISACEVDFNADGIVDLEDYSRLARDFFTDSRVTDVNLDDWVDLLDYSLMARFFFDEC